MDRPTETVEDQKYSRRIYALASLLKADADDEEEEETQFQMRVRSKREDDTLIAKKAPELSFSLSLTHV